MKPILTLFFTFCLFYSYSQISFSNQKIVQSDGNSTFPIEFFSVDVNNDGLKDILTGDRDKKRLVLHKNDGNAEMGIPNILSDSINGIFSVHYGDIDIDGDIDLIATSYSDDKIYWFENINNNSFATQQTLISGLTNPNSSRLFDLDNDNDLDLIYVSSNDDKIAWYENLGNLSFSSEIIITNTLNNATAFEFLDIDGDALKDIVSFSRTDSKIVSFKNLGSGSFGSEVIIDNLSDMPEMLIYEDIDLDNDFDLVVYSRASSGLKTITKYLNDGIGVFSASVITSSSNFNRPIAFGNVTADNLPDIVIGNSNQNKIKYLANLGAANFGAIQDLFQYSSGLVSNVNVSDIDNDGFEDIFYNSINNNSFKWHKKIAVNNYAEAQTLDSDISVVSGFLSADLNNDGYKDMIASSATMGTYFYKNFGNNKFSNQNILDLTSASGGHRDLVLHDHNGDQLIDIFVLDASTSSIVWYQNLGNFQFSAANVVANTPVLKEFKLFDIDSDGDLDVAGIIGNFNTKVVWYENLNGTFGTVNTLLEYNVNSSFRIKGNIFADIDGDNDIDIVGWGELSSSKIIWFENTGNLTYTTEHIINDVYSNPKKVQAVDINNDGDLDILSLINSNSVVSFENAGNGTFVNETFISQSSSNFQPRDLSLEDLNADGFIDVLIASYSDQKVSLYENDGLGGFPTQQLITSDQKWSSVVGAVDIDNDNDLDIISGGTELWWFENNTLYPKPIISSFNLQNASCFDECNGSIVIEITNGFSPYTIQWNNGDSTSSISNLCNGEYIVTITDDSSRVFVDTFLISEPIQVSDVASVVEACDSVFIGNEWHFSTGSFIDTLSTFTGCDSIVSYSFNIFHSIETLLNDTIENGESFDLPDGSTVSSTGQYINSFSTVNNCDSLIIVNLHVKEPIISSINDVALGLQIYPNPVKNVLIIEADFEFTKTEILNRLGQTVFTETENTKEISVSDLSSGIYFVKISIENKVFVSRFVKE